MPPKKPNRPRRQAKQERSRQMVEALLEASARVLRERGYAGATTNRIAEAAGASVGTLYEYFRNKEAVYDALIEREIERLVQAILAEGLALEAPVEEILDRILRSAMSALHYGPDFIRALEQVPGAIFRSRLENGRRAVVEFVRQLLEAHRAELRVDDLELAAFVTVSAAEGIASNSSGDLFDDRIVDEIVTVLRLYLKSA